MSTPLASQLKDVAMRWHKAGECALVVSVAQAKGSVPREPGARMLVSKTEVLGTIGGGHLEWQAVDLARHALREPAATSASASAQAWLKTFPLGPALGQCCGGVVALRFEPLTENALAAWPCSQPLFHLDLHGAGHVGQAIVHLLKGIDCTVRWIDARDIEDDWPGRPDDRLLTTLPTHITWLPSEQPEAEVASAPAGACHLVLTHRHDLDLRIIEAVLRRGDAVLAGLIGSDSKRARFLHRLSDKGLSERQLSKMVCPIGLPGIRGKAPEVIAVSVVASLLLAQPSSIG
jgi:xanthine dehydrogenase accessory factor